MAARKSISGTATLEANGNGHANGNGNGTNRITPEATGITIPRLRVETADFPIIGTSSLIVNKWSKKAVEQMLGKQMGKARGPKEPKVPEDDYNAARYIATEGGWDGVPSVAFKAACVGACRLVDGLAMTTAKRLLFVHPDGRDAEGTELTRIVGEPKMRRDLVRLETGTADVRFRPEYVEWSAVLRVQFVASQISLEMVANLLEIAGQTEGICEWRPSAPKSCTGTHGLFRLVR